MAKAVTHVKTLPGESLSLDAFNLILAATRDEWKFAGHIINAQPDGLFSILCTVLGAFRAVVAGLDERDRDRWFWAARRVAIDARHESPESVFVVPETGEDNGGQG